MLLHAGGLLPLAAITFAGGVILPLSAEAQEASSTPPVISAIFAVPADTSATVTWTTDQAATTQVAYGTTTSYGASSTLDMTDVTSHSVSLTSLTPGTLYHFQVLSGNASGTLATSSDGTFVTTEETATTTTAAPVISGIAAKPADTTAVIAWTTDQAATSQVTYGTTTAYGFSSTLDPADVTNHSVTLADLVPNTAYHYEVWSADASGTLATSSDQTFMTTVTTVTPPATSTPDLATLQSEIRDLQNRVRALERELSSLSGFGGGGNRSGQQQQGGIRNTTDRHGSGNGWNN